MIKIIGSILCSTNGFTHKNNDTIKKHIKSQRGLCSIDLGCIADYGSFVVDYEGEEDTNEKEFEKRYLDYYGRRVFKSLEFSKPENSLVTFFMQLTRYLQQAIGTVPAIDLKKYLNEINEDLDEEI